MSEPNSRDKEIKEEIDLAFYRRETYGEMSQAEVLDIIAAYRDEIEARLAPAPAQSREEEALGDDDLPESAATWMRRARELQDENDELRARLASAQSSAQGEETSSILDRLRHLTPGGSDFQTADECFAWVEKRLTRKPWQGEEAMDDEPLSYMNRAELQLNIMRNIEREIKNLSRGNEGDEGFSLRYWWNKTANWAKVQRILNGNTHKAGSTSSIAQCRFIGADPDGYSFAEARAALERKEGE